jgi:hypothetical protein
MHLDDRVLVVLGRASRVRQFQLARLTCMGNELLDVGRAQKERLDELHSVHQKRDDMYRRFRTAILRVEDETLQSRVMQWIPLSNN